MPTIILLVMRMSNGAKEKIQLKNMVLISSVDGVQKDFVYLKCKFYNKLINGGVKRLIKKYLVCTHLNIRICEKVPNEVKKECADYLKKLHNLKSNSSKKYRINY